MYKKEATRIYYTMWGLKSSIYNYKWSKPLKIVEKLYYTPVT